jgi:hypothetical protein
MLPPALWLLIGLNFRSSWRRFRRGLRTWRGAFVAGLTILLLGACLVPAALVSLLRPDDLQVVSPEFTRRWYPLVLAALLALGLFNREAAEGALAFTPAEVQWLFPAPFTRRELLCYRLVTLVTACGILAAFLGPFFSLFGGGLLGGFLAIWLGLLLLQLANAAVTLAANLVGALAYTRARRAALAGLAVLAAAALLPEVQAWSQPDPRPAWERLQDLPDRSWAVAVAAAPLRPFVEVFVAAQLWPDLAGWLAVCLAELAALTAAVLAMDRQLLEVGALASERLFARLERMARGGALAPLHGRERAGRGLPMLPWWGGAGPLAWRQLTLLRRRSRTLLLFAGGFGILLALSGRFIPANPTEGVFLAVGTLFYAVMLLAGLLRFDFRGDYDRMDVLKSLPVAPPGVVAGQLLVPVTAGTAVTLLLALAAWSSPAVPWTFLVGAALFAPAANWLLVGLDNLVFLLVPTPPFVPGQQVDSGRVLLNVVIRGLALMVSIAVVAGAAAGGYFAAGGSWPAAAGAAWLVTAGLGAGLAPLLVHAYRRFDVVQDRPE